MKKPIAYRYTTKKLQKKSMFSHDFGLRSPVIYEPFQTKCVTPLSSRVTSSIALYCLVKRLASLFRKEGVGILLPSIWSISCQQP